MKRRTLLMIPGPVEYEPAVLSALGAPTTSHMDPAFIDAFGESLTRLRQVFLSDNGQPFILAGSGTLGLDLAAANLIEPGDKAILISTGFFSDRFGEILERYGANLTILKAPRGERISLQKVEDTLKTGGYKMLVYTHIETSTGVSNDVKALADLAHRYGALSIVDGVCSVGGEELRMSEWGLDVVLTASQKAIGVPPGLSLFVVSEKAMQVYQMRKSPVINYYGDWGNWLPVMVSIEKRIPSYFCTPPVNLIFALNTGLELLLAEGLEARFARHRALNAAVKAGVEKLGLKQVPIKPEFRANTVTAIYYPQGVEPAKFLSLVGQEGIVLAGGLHPDFKNEYFRIGHMGAANLGDVLATIGAIENALKACGYPFELGAGLAAAQKAYSALRPAAR